MGSRTGAEDASDRRYFGSMQSALVEDGHCEPVLVVDRDRLDANLDRCRSGMPEGIDIRIVAKSLPSPDLLRYAMDYLGTDRLMTFSLTMLNQLSDEIPHANQLLGKPFPVRAASRFYSERKVVPTVHWLIDTTERLAQYGDLAIRIDRVLDVSLELDIGLHRGGFTSQEDLRPALELLRTNPQLRFAGFMGYEAHLGKMPSQAGLRRRGYQTAMGHYQQAIDMAVQVLGADRCDSAIWNSGGSMTFALHREQTVANEISIGSAFLKGTDFDLDLLNDLEPAVFIATPVLKVLESTQVPGLELVERTTSKLPGLGSKALFIHGGHWLAKPVFPPGLKLNRLYGRSSNQEMLNGSVELEIWPDDFVFLRPTQTEAVLLQFGDLALLGDGKIIDSWPVLPASA